MNFKCLWIYTYLRNVFNKISCSEIVLLGFNLFFVSAFVFALKEWSCPCTLHHFAWAPNEQWLLGMVFVCRLKIFTCNRVIFSIINGSNKLKSYLVFDNKGNNKITELRTILQRESQNSKLYKQTKSVNNRKTVKTVMTLTWYRHF